MPDVVTRFAPSPTGYLHVGGARTALFCWLMARHNKGRFILRIEDTDQKRNTPTATQQVMQDLQWLGIHWDEGPLNADGSEYRGDNGPYLQSQRMEIYNRYLKQLLDEGKAYYCFETQQELQELREQAMREKKSFIYPRPEVFPTEQDVARARAEGRPVVVRFVADQRSPIIVKDIVRGDVTFPPGEVGDFIIRKSDGFPTYHFACVVDDELMGVTHIIRGQEHLMNTPGHQLLQRALGFRIPLYAHMSVTVSESGGKLSKREQAKSLLQTIKKQQAQLNMQELARAGDISAEQLTEFLQGKSTPDGPCIIAMAKYLGLHLPEINVVDFRRSGYIPEAMVNFLALLGWSPGDDREIMTIDELVEAFDITRLNKTNSLFDRKKLMAFNTDHMRRLGPDKLLKYFKDYLSINDSPVAGADDKVLLKLLKACEGARRLADVEQKSRFLFLEQVEFDPKAVKKVLKKQGAEDLLTQARAALACLSVWDEKSIHNAIMDLCTVNEVGMGKVAQPIRVAITGSMISPGIVDSLLLLGQERTVKRIDDTLAFMKTIS